MSTKNFRKLLADNSFPRVVTAEIAMTYDGIIGIGSKLLYNIPQDMERFVQNTTGKIVVMGRKTFESMGCKPLKTGLTSSSLNRCTPNTNEMLKQIQNCLFVQTSQTPSNSSRECLFGKTDKSVSSVVLKFTRCSSRTSINGM